MCGILAVTKAYVDRFFEFAPAMSGQVIVLSFANFYQEMKTKPHCQLRLDEHSKAMRLTKARCYGLSVRR